MKAKKSKRQILTFKQFKSQWGITIERICADIYNQNRDKISIKKENVAVKNIGRILDAVFELSREKGFHSMSLRDLSRKTGLSMGALYSYFTGKDELCSIIQKQGVGYTKKIIVEQAQKYENPADRLVAAIETHLYLSELMRSWFFFAYMEASTLPKEEKLEAMENEIVTEALFVDILNEGNKTGAFDCADVALTAAAIKAMLQDWYLKRWKYKRKNIGVEDYAVFVNSFVFSSISPKRQGGVRCLS